MRATNRDQRCITSSERVVLNSSNAMHRSSYDYVFPGKRQQKSRLTIIGVVRRQT